MFVFGHAMFMQGLAHNGLNRPPWIQAGIGVLENHLNALAHGLGIAGLEGGMGVLPIKGQAAPRGLIQAHQQTSNGAFTAT